MSCQKFYHFPCVAASGSFQVMQTFTIFCKEHLGQVPLVCKDDINCVTCAGLGDVGNLLMCTLCGDHYHGTCIGVPQLPGVRSGWQCQSCRVCQICRIPDQVEGRSLACEQCDKGKKSFTISENCFIHFFFINSSISCKLLTSRNDHYSKVWVEMSMLSSMFRLWSQKSRCRSLFKMAQSFYSLRLLLSTA